MEDLPRSTKIRHLNVKLCRVLASESEFESNKTVNIGDHSNDTSKSDINEDADLMDIESTGPLNGPELQLPDSLSEFCDNLSTDFEALFSEGGFTENCSEDESPTCISLSERLATWASQNKLTRAAINELLVILKDSGHKELPKDARTLLKTPRMVPTLVKAGGDYTYIGIQKGICKSLRHTDLGERDSTLKLSINVDGLPIWKSSGHQIWPILGQIDDFHPFPIALYFGTTKPRDVNEFLEDFLVEYKTLKETGFVMDALHFNISIRLFPCDAPARQLLKGVKAHNAYYGCERCEVKGEWEGRVVFHDLDAPLRTDEKFANLDYENHQTVVSPLATAGFKCISIFPLECLHMVDFGGTKRLIKFLTAGPRVCRISAAQVQRLSECLEALKGTFPSEFSRQPRSLKDLKYYKAVEFRSFLLYSGPVVLKGVVNDEIYTHFVSFSVAIRILGSRLSKEPEMVNYARQLLRWFVAESRKLYGSTFTTYTIHSLIHIPDDVTYHKSNIYEMSAYPFENYLGMLKRVIRSANSPLAQVVKRLDEMESCNTHFAQKHLYTKVGTGPKDGWFITKKKKFVLIRKICGHILTCHSVPHQHLKDFFSMPCRSGIFDIYAFSNTCVLKKENVILSDLDRKVVSIQRGTNTILIPLISSVKFSSA